MPTYCFTNHETGETLERVFRIADVPKRIRAYGEVFVRDIAAEHQGSSYLNRKKGRQWPMKSDAAGCHPADCAAWEADAASRGVPTEFERGTGRAVFRSREHRKRYCEARGIYDRSGGYGDPQQSTKVEVPNKDAVDYSRKDAQY